MLYSLVVDGLLGIFDRSNKAGTPRQTHTYLNTQTLASSNTKPLISFVMLCVMARHTQIVRDTYMRSICMALHKYLVELHHIRCTHSKRSDFSNGRQVLIATSLEALSIMITALYKLLVRLRIHRHIYKRREMFTHIQTNA